MSILRRIFPILLTAALLCACVQMPNTPQDVLPATTPRPRRPPPPRRRQPHADARADSGPRDGDGHDHATKDAPQIKDPTTWDDNAAKTLAG